MSTDRYHVLSINSVILSLTELLTCINLNVTATDGYNRCLNSLLCLGINMFNSLSDELSEWPLLLLLHS